MKAKELDDFCAGLIPDRRGEGTCDGIKTGSPDKQLSRVGVTFYVTNAIIEEAARLGLDGIVTHEPTFYDHLDTSESRTASATARAKGARIDELGLVIIRLHDCWDSYPEYGIGDATARALGWTEPVSESGISRVFRIDETTLAGLARHVHQVLGSPNPRIFGDPEAMISTVGLCWGHNSLKSVIACVEAGADCVLMGEIAEWQGPQYALDSGVTMIYGGHCSTEKKGMESCRELLAESFPDVEFVYLDTPEVFGPPVVASLET